MTARRSPFRPSRLLHAFKTFRPFRSSGHDIFGAPLRGEPLGAEHLAERARAVAREQHLASRGDTYRAIPLLTRLDETRGILRAARVRLEAVPELDVGPAGEWLLDNFHVIDEQIREVRESLPRGYYRELPSLARGPLTGHPRVFELATTLISHTEGRLDLGLLDLFVGEFQKESALTIGELWALPSVLRLGLLENVRRMTLRTIQRLDQVAEANAWAARVQVASDQGEVALNQCLHDFLRQSPSLTPAFVSRFLQQLRHATGPSALIARLEQWIADEGLSAEDADSRSNQRLALTQMMMANSITSLRVIAGLDWRAFVERHSVMDARLRQDPIGAYQNMTFATRDRYRHAAERIAKRTGRGEVEVAEGAITLARGAKAAGNPAVQEHVGYYLVDGGVTRLEAQFGYRLSAREVIHRFVLQHPSLLLTGSIGAGIVIVIGLLSVGLAPEHHSAWLAIALFALLPVTDAVISAAHQLVTVLLPPRLLSKLELRDGGIPDELRTLVVIPTLFGNLDAVREALETLEVQYLANREPNLRFALLGDFTDADAEVLPEDAAILETASAGVHTLNEQYRVEGGAGPFALFHRPRRFNPGQGCWMGWERKRGKLAELNAFLRGGAASAFNVVIGEESWLRQVRYVITLDSDTVLPPEAAAALVGAIAHPLNRAVYDKELGRVVRGHGILQPRVVVSLPSANASRFAAIYSGSPGVDPYTTAVSDLYQDLYGEGSYTGKGIYDVDAFELATRGRFPERRLLSHDLIEGSFARAGLVTDINVYDDYPSRYLTFTRRKHRWIRGDWQLLRWLGFRVPGPTGVERNHLSLVSRWKILDNLRRSVLDVAQLAFLVAGWTILPGSPLGWTLVVLLTIAAPWLNSLLWAALRPPFDRSVRTYYAALARDATTSLLQVGLTVTFLPHQAAVAVDAIVRTLYRLFISKERLLEWQTALQVERAAAAGNWRQMWQAPALALALGGMSASYALANGGVPAVLRLAPALLPFIVLWFASPAIAFALGAPPRRPKGQLSNKRREQARRYALLHWRFFERFVDDSTRWLAPDNFQESPSPVVALRTSPTNIGLQLLSTVSAHDLGFISLEEMTLRLERAFASIEELRKFQGHLYNWYDLNDLRVLEPAYVSTVDSGNLAGHLIALRQACLAIIDAPPVQERTWGALEAALALANEAPSSRTGGASDALRAARTKVIEARSTRPATFVRLGDALRAARAASENLAGPAAATVQLATDGWLPWAEHRLRAHEESILASVGSASAPWPPTASLRQFAEQSVTAAALVERLEALAARAYAWALGMDFRFLYDAERKLFGIGFHEQSRTLDGSYYDLLASESRLASFVAVAKNDAPVEHWFRLGRTLTHAGGQTALVSWSGSMFEYLMPPLVMESVPGTLLAQTHRGALRRQIAYGAARGVPWGVSESAYNVRDRHFTYQYRAFGVPDLALKRGLGRDLVIAPYASAMAVMFEPARALENLEALEELGALGPYGLRDSLDFTRPTAGQPYALVQTYMAHHVGMAFVALTNALTENIWPQRFHADPLVRAAELLLHERIPRRLASREAQPARAEDVLTVTSVEEPSERIIDVLDTPEPHVALLGRLPYTIMVSHCGSGYSRYEDLAVTRWRADGTSDNSGQFIYIADLTADRLWSATHQPVCAPPDQYRAVLATDRVTFHRVDGEIETRTEIATSPEDAAEVRRVTLRNTGNRVHEIELTSYGEIVLGRPDADRAHPAFANLFVETEWHEWCTAITATRRPRSAHESPLWCVHVIDAQKDRVATVSCETDRARFLGRGRSTREPLAVIRAGALSGTTGPVLDPIFALRTRVRLEPGQTASVAFTTLVATTRERAFALADRYQDPHGAQRALDLAWTATQAELRELGVTSKEAGVFQELAAHLFFATPSLRAPQEELLSNRGAQPSLWAHGISGDWPILLANIEGMAGLPTLRQLLAAHSYWRRHGMLVDLVVLITQPSDYLQELSDTINTSFFAAGVSEVVDRPGGVFVRRRDLLSPEDLLMLRATARVHVSCDGRPLRRILEQLVATPRAAEPRPAPATTRPAPGRTSERNESGELVTRASSRAREPVPLDSEHNEEKTPSGTRLSVAPGKISEESAPGSGDARSKLLFDNGTGGLTSDHRYRIDVTNDTLPPAPWANVIAGPRGGFVVTERGGGYCWAENSYFFRLTPWHNDPVSDPPGEVLYLRDDDTGDLWSATPAPVRHQDPFTIHHGAGRSTFEHIHEDISTRLTLGVAEEGAVKVSLLSLTNRGSRTRRLTVTSYTEWTLGVLREHTQHQVVTTFDRELGAVFAQNSFDPQFAGWVAFSASSAEPEGHSGNRRTFIGRNGTLSAPAALNGALLDGATGGGLDPCAALQSSIEIAPGETRELAFLLGAMDSADAARAALSRLRTVTAAKAAVDESTAEWAARLSVITVHTPDPAFDAMLNQWALYQALACRTWARSALYQSSGAFGFRDQLQDVMAFVYAEPALARAHILLAASRQFVEGDVQHWWHPQSGRGVRTKFSDDLAWLPYVVDHYVRVTGDISILSEDAPFLTMRALAEDEHEIYDLPNVSTETASVYEHCLRALRRAFTTGAHGLPLIGIGDWNDGMSRVGVAGRGESVWLAWFLATTARRFASRATELVAHELRTHADGYVAAAEAHGWDGAWYRRAYFDDGSPLGSASSDECRIDSIAQSWSVISGAGAPARQRQAMKSFETHLVDEQARILLLLDPPFDKTAHDPGYIKGYLPGVRENGAQYTHAALWAVLATALAGDGDRAFELFQMLNPLLHTRTAAEVAKYKVEPYVVAADVYTAAGQRGRGGWTWYTGSASWMYRVGLESLLGFVKCGETLTFAPKVPRTWPGFTVEYRYGESHYEITIETGKPQANPSWTAGVTLDGKALERAELPLVDDGRRHKVRVRVA